MPGIISALAERFAVVAVVSGRPVEYLESQLGRSPNVTLVGLYGLERIENGEHRVDGRRCPVGRGRSVRSHCSNSNGAAGVGGRNEGADACAALPAVLPRRCSGRSNGPPSEPVPAGWSPSPDVSRSNCYRRCAPTKARWSKSSPQSSTPSCFFGDDVGDLPAFSALRRLRSGGKTTIAVGVESPEQPDELASAVDLLVGGAEEAVALLGSLAEGRRLPLASDR